MSSIHDTLRAVGAIAPAAPPATREEKKGEAPVEVAVVTRPIFKDAFAAISDSPCTDNDERVYLTTNEIHNNSDEKTLKLMSALPMIGNTIIAVSVFFGLNLVAARGKAKGKSVDYLIMVDRSSRTQMLWTKLSKIILESTLVTEAWKTIKKMLLKDFEQFWPVCNCGNPTCDETPIDMAIESVGNVEIEIRDGYSWLSTQENFEKIKRIFVLNQFVFKRINLFDDKKTTLLSKTIQQLGLEIDTFYLSNLRESAERNECLTEFYKSMTTLRTAMTDKTMIIDTKPRPDGKNSEFLAEQRVIHKIVSSDIVKLLSTHPYRTS